MHCMSAFKTQYSFFWSDGHAELQTKPPVRRGMLIPAAMPGFKAGLHARLQSTMLKPRSPLASSVASSAMKPAVLAATCAEAGDVSLWKVLWGEEEEEL